MVRLIACGGAACWLASLRSCQQQQLLLLLLLLGWVLVQRLTTGAVCCDRMATLRVILDTCR